jgi:hypothetical protein
MNIQKNNYSFHICFTFLFLILSSQILISQSLQFYTVDPNVVYRGDENTKINIEVTITGQDITRVHIVAPIETDLYDDGTNGDRIAGDGIYTINGVDHNTANLTLFFGGTHNSWGRFHLKIEKTDNSVEEHWLSIGVVEENQQYEVTKLADDLYATQYAFFIVDAAGETLDITEWPLGNVRCGKENFEITQKFYSVMPDIFDFIITMPSHPIYKPDTFGENSPYFVRAKNEIQNIGIDIFNNTGEFGSAGRLIGTIYHSWGYGSILDHEIAHAWCADIGESLDLCRGENSGWSNHWNKYSDIAGQMASFIANPDVATGAGHLLDNGDGTWRIEREPTDNMPYSMLDLYVMGLIPKEEVPPIHLLHDIDQTDPSAVTAAQVETITIDDIIAAEGGERIPSFDDSPNEFNVAFVVIKNKEFTDAEYAFYSSVSRYFASEEQGFPSLTTFYTATGGRGSLDPDLHLESLTTKNESYISDYSLSQNYPNPFNPETTIQFKVAKSGHVKLKVHNLLGKKVMTLIDSEYQPGQHSVTFNANQLTAGVYFYRISTGDYTAVKKMVLIK